MRISVFPILQILRKIAFVLLRAVMGVIFITHGAARLYYASVPDFGAFLNSQGLIIGELIAWIITIGEIIGGLFLITGYLMRYAIIFHFIVVLTGIFMVHLQNGWFVVGHGQGGVEYSVLILAVLFCPFNTSTKNRYTKKPVFKY